MMFDCPSCDAPISFGPASEQNASLVELCHVEMSASLSRNFSAAFFGWQGNIPNLTNAMRMLS